LDKRPYLNVSAKLGSIVEFAPEYAGSHTEIVDMVLKGGHVVWYFTLTNPREKTVRVMRLRLLLPQHNKPRPQYIFYATTDLPGDKPLPCDIESLDSTRFWLKPERISQTVSGFGYSGKVQLVVEVQDAVGNTFTDEFVIDTNDPTSEA
jgi:hypothetical protein